VTLPDRATQLREHATRHSVPGAALGVLQDASSGEPVTLALDRAAA
jgi:hypothetical protein